MEKNSEYVLHCERERSVTISGTCKCGISNKPRGLIVWMLGFDNANGPSKLLVMAVYT